MVDEIRLQAGEFTTLVRFFKTSDGLLDGTDLQIYDAHTAALFPETRVPRHVWPAGEAHKGWPQIDSVLTRALELGLARDSTFAGVGGGVVTDMAAFAASLYMRGCRLVLVPTTLLAMVDAALGGKTGIDYGGFKNLVGSFYPAHELRIWPGALASLPDRDYRSGLAEVLKHAFLNEAHLLELLETRREAVLGRDPAVLDELVFRAVMVKVGVVERDLRETGERAFLNLGHTFGHALEAVMGFDGSWTHGEAVCWGMARAFELGATLGRTDPAWRDKAVALMASYGFKLTAPGADAGAILKAMKNDKKKKGGLVRFVLQENQGRTFQQAVDDDTVLACIQGGV
jgi:3-dehydroquinate synthase